jgi:TolB-like protein/Tfp pilus assembly protein PilF
MGELRRARNRAFQFGVFEVNLRAGELRKRGVKVKLQEQPLQVLQILLENPGEVVTREEMQRRIWPADTFVDFDHGLNNAIRRLREALGDSADTPRYIETLSRRGYRFIGSMGTLQISSPAPIRSLAVLPLENLSHDPQQEYFAEGLTEALITTLAKIGELRVVSRTSAMLYKGVRKPLREIARELEVDAIVEGTVLRAGRRVRITAQLIDAPKEAHLWAESYERDLHDVLSLQAELAQAIAREVQVKLTPQEQAQIAQVHRVDPEAYEAYLKGRFFWNRRRGGEIGRAVRYFQEAITKDPSYASAYAGFADCVSALGHWDLVSPDEGCGRGKELAVQALQMDRGLAEAHASLAFATMFYDYDFVVAEKEFERSIELNPQYATAHAWFGLYLCLMGCYEEGYIELQRAIRLEPFSIMMHVILAYVHLCDRRNDQAIEVYEKALELDPNFAHAYTGLGIAYLKKAMPDPAIASHRRAVELSQGGSFFVTFLGSAYAAGGYRDEAQQILKQLQDRARQEYVTPYGVSRILAALGEKDEALDWLEKGYQERAAGMAYLMVDWGFDNLRSHPRFQDLLRRMNFPP